MIEVRKHGRHWAVYDGDTLVCVCLYKKGAEEVKRRTRCRLTPHSRVNLASDFPLCLHAATTSLASLSRRQGFPAT